LVAAWNKAALPSFASHPILLTTKQQPHGPGPKPLEDKMQSITHSKLVKALQPSPKRQPRKPASPWQPQSGSLTREEIRAIVIDQIG
jgi:hypothetical protein